jgi:branched-chain amino acid transport system permease protein
MRGINTTYVKIGIFMLAGGLTASIGGTKAWWDGYIDPDTIFPATYTIEIIMMTMLGGIGRPWGPVLGAVLFYYGRTVIWASAGNLQLLFTGVLLAGVVLFMRGGILGLLDPEDRGRASTGTKTRPTTMRAFPFRKCRSKPSCRRTKCKSPG